MTAGLRRERERKRGEGLWGGWGGGRGGGGLQMAGRAERLRSGFLTAFLLEKYGVKNCVGGLLDAPPRSSSAGQAVRRGPRPNARP